MDLAGRFFGVSNLGSDAAFVWLKDRALRGMHGADGKRFSASVRRRAAQRRNLPADVTYAAVSFRRQPRGHAADFGDAVEQQGKSRLVCGPAMCIFGLSDWVVNHRVGVWRVRISEQREACLSSRVVVPRTRLQTCI